MNPSLKLLVLTMAKPPVVSARARRYPAERAVPDGSGTVLSGFAAAIPVTSRLGTIPLIHRVDGHVSTRGRGNRGMQIFNRDAADAAVVVEGFASPPPVRW